jgi:hypothetical protein
MTQTQNGHHPTSHLSDDDLVLAYYREAIEVASIAAGTAEDHLASCAECRARQNAIASVLDTMTSHDETDADANVDGLPRPDAAFEARLIASALRRPVAVPPSKSVFRRFVLPAAGLSALAASLVVGIWTGVSIGRERGLEEARVAAERSRERVVLSAVSSHLERSRMTLVTLRNTDGASKDLTELQEAAGELVRASRLFRAAALKVGEAPVLAVMEETERLLVRFANAPSEDAASELESLRRRVESRDLVFRLRAMESQVQKREKVLAPTVL